MITFIESDGNALAIDAGTGISLMEVAVNNGIPGIEADCGGACACATCHVYVSPEWQARMPPREQIEAEMLEFAVNQRDTSRLSCQILVTDMLDGMTVELPASQT